MKIKRNETYGSFIKRIRQTAKLTQADFAIAVGVGANSVSQWEKGHYEPNFVSKRAIDEFARKIK